MKRSTEMKRRMGVIVCAVVAGILLLGGAAYGGYRLWIDPYRGTVQEFQETGYTADDMLSRQQAEEDLEYLMKCMRERHPAWLDDSGKDQLAEQQYEKELSMLNEEVSFMELYRAAARIAATLHDGHTCVSWQDSTEADFIDDFDFLRSHGNPLTINGVDSEEILAAYKELCSYEREEYAEARFWGNVVVSKSALELCGVKTGDHAVMTFEQDGRKVEHSFSFVLLDQVKGYQQQEDGLWVSYDIDEENSVGVFKLTSCICDSEYKAVLDSFFQEVFQKEISHVVVDLRGNGGGSSLVANEFLKYIDVDSYDGWDSAVRLGNYLMKNEDVVYDNKKTEQVFGGKLYVLTDIWTYSSAMDFAMLVQDNQLGMVIGEASGNLPDSYGDCLYFQLPNSGLALSVSHKRWYRIDQEKAGEPILPDVEVDSLEALQKVYELIEEEKGE